MISTEIIKKAAINVFPFEDDIDSMYTTKLREGYMRGIIDVLLMLSTDEQRGILSELEDYGK
jgi:hypothetical protein